MGDYATVMNPRLDQAERTLERIIGNSVASSLFSTRWSRWPPQTRTGKELIANMPFTCRACGRAFIKA